MPPRKPKKKPGEKRRKYTQSPKTDAQRRVAARTHGKTCATAVRQVLPACIRRQCPLADADGTGYPCTLKQRVEEVGGVVESCPLPLVTSTEAAEAYRNALAKGDLSGLANLTATALGSLAGTTVSELRKVAEEGFKTETEVVIGMRGETPITSTVEKKNPRAEVALDAMKVLGLTADQQQLTPKSQGDAKRGDAAAGFFSGLKQFSAFGPTPTAEGEA
jgi:hypothetical protein